MSLRRYEPWYFVNRLQRNLDRPFASPALVDEPQQPVADWVSPVDIREQDKQFVIHADLPGVEPQHIEVTLEHGVLAIRGRRDLEARDEQQGFRRVERISGQFFRRFSLPGTADSQAVKARFGNGVLEVAIPKQAQVLPRRINVEAA